MISQNARALMCVTSSVHSCKVVVDPAHPCALNECSEFRCSAHQGMSRRAFATFEFNFLHLGVSSQVSVIFPSGQR